MVVVLVVTVAIVVVVVVVIAVAAWDDGDGCANFVVELVSNLATCWAL